jgi:hypothetical protein
MQCGCLGAVRCWTLVAGIGIAGVINNVVSVILIVIDQVRPLVDVIVLVGGSGRSKFAPESTEVRVGGEVLEFPRHFGVFCFLSAAPHA